MSANASENNTKNTSSGPKVTPPNPYTYIKYISTSMSVSASENNA